MATLVLSAVGTIFGGPLGGALGALAGRQIDGALVGSKGREGPRLKDLAVSTSTYGQPIARQYGDVRVPGTIIWATDLVEHREESGGGKGRPKTTSYTYSASFAVALSSRPIDAVGRIWADGNLLRGAVGDLKTAGTLRVHEGYADQQPDPLMEAALGAKCPAFRGSAYAVFEDLQLADFGNRIPSLSFEIFAGDAAALVPAMLGGSKGTEAETATFPELRGFSHDGGSFGQIVSMVSELNPLIASAAGTGLAVSSAKMASAPVFDLPESASWDEGDFGQRDGVARHRSIDGSTPVGAIRYYDIGRDYQPGVQRAEGLESTTTAKTLEFPGSLSAGDAKNLAQALALRQEDRSQTLSWRLAQLDPNMVAGSLVRVPSETGLWRIEEWEWREKGVELMLVRITEPELVSQLSDPGSSWRPPDLLLQPTILRAFELPWDGFGSADDVGLFAAASARDGAWHGASLYAGKALTPIDQFAARPAISGALVAPLGGSPSVMLEPQSELTVRLDSTRADLSPATTEDLAVGANRLLVGNEVLQFANAKPLGNGLWTLSGLLRGRGGTEEPARRGHPVGTLVTLLDNRLVRLGPQAATLASDGTVAAIGVADAEPVVADVENPGLSRRPLIPVHPEFQRAPGGPIQTSWCRRARGGWSWLDNVAQPLVEEAESYEVGIGDTAAPSRLWLSSEPSLSITAADANALAVQHPGAALWVRQIGSFGRSAPLLLGHLT